MYKFYTLGPCTFEACVYYLELVQDTLHRQKYTYYSDYHCDVVQLLLCLYPNNLKKILIDANIGTTLSWSQLNDEADIILSTLKEAGRSLYDPLPTGKSVPPFNPSISPLCPPLKSVLLFHHQFLPSMSMALLQRKFNTKSCLHLTRLQLPKFLSQKFIRLSYPCS